MKKITIILFVLCISGSVLSTPIKQASETIAFFLKQPIDSALGIERIPDSVHVFTYADNATTATFTTRSTTYPFSDISIDTLKNYGDTSYIFTDQIQDIDGAGGNFVLSIEVKMFTGIYPMSTFYDVQVVSDSLNEFAKGADLLTEASNIGINWGDITNPTTSQNLSATNIDVDQVIGSVSGAVGSVTAGVTVTTNNDKTGYSLTQTFPTNFADLTISLTTGLVDINDKTGFALTTQDWTTDADLVPIAKEASLFDWTTNQVIVTTNNDKTDYEILASDKDILVDLMADEPLTGATHNVANSWGRRVRNQTDDIVHTGTAQGAGTGTNQIQLDLGASAVDGTYDPSIITLVEGTTGGGQSRMILQYDGATKIATVNRDWRVQPTSATDFVIQSSPGFFAVNEGLAQGGTINTITLNIDASSSNNVYIDQGAFLVSGDASDQVGRITAYNGTTKVATIDKDWAVTPNTTTAYIMLPFTDGAASEVMDSLRASPVVTIPADTTETGDSTLTKQMLLAMPASDTTTNTYLSTLLRLTNLNVFQVDTLTMYMGYNSTSSRSVNGLDTETDTLHIYEGATEIRRLLFWHIGGAEGDAPDSVTVAL